MELTFRKKKKKKIDIFEQQMAFDGRRRKFCVLLQ